MRVSLIAAVDQEFGIGYRNQLLCHLPADLKWFKQQTMSHPILMGRNTFESIGRILPGRRNIVISKTLNELPAGAERFDALGDALKSCAGHSDVFIIGGSRMFEEGLTLADRLVLTHIDHTFQADTWFPKFSHDIWRVAFEAHHLADESNRFDYTFRIWEKN